MLNGFVQIDRANLVSPGIPFVASGIMNFLRAEAAIGPFTYVHPSGFHRQLEKGEVYVTLRAIARAGGCSLGTVQKYVGLLLNRGRIKVVTKTPFGTVFRIMEGIVAKIKKAVYDAGGYTRCTNTATSRPQPASPYKKIEKIKSGFVGLKESERSGPPVMTHEENQAYLAKLDAVVIAKSLPTEAKNLLATFKAAW